jgi:hypothetical protein
MNPDLSGMTECQDNQVPGFLVAGCQMPVARQLHGNFSIQCLPPNWRKCCALSLCVAHLCRPCPTTPGGRLHDSNANQRQFKCKDNTQASCSCSLVNTIKSEDM